MFVELIIVAGLTLAVSLGLTRAMLAVAPRLGLMDQPGERRIHETPIPRAGGIAIWLSFLLVVGGGLASGYIKPSGHVSWQWLAAFAAGSLVLMVAGFLDDRSGLRPLVKLGAHALAPSLFFLLHPVETGLFPADWHWGCEYLVFVGWAVLLINAFNLIDGLDGLCGGLSAVASVALAALALMHGRLDSALLLLAMAGAILGFLKYNFNPARIFLGDAGSMLMGFFLATAATDAVGRKAVVGAILLPIAVAGVPLLDVLLAVWRRGARRVASQLQGETSSKGIFDADSDHLHHRLLASGVSQRKVATVLHGISILLALLAFLPLMFGDRVYGISIVGFMILGMVGVRNLARVEIEHTGSVIHMAIKLPGARRRVAAALFIYDLLVLAAAATAAVLVETNFLMRGAPVEQLGRFVVLFILLGSLITLVVQIHRRLWVRATMRDILSLQFWLLIAATATFTLFSLGYEALEWSALRLTVMSYVFACIGVCLPRVTLDFFRDVGLEARHRNPKHENSERYGPVVILGAGDLGTLLLDHLKSSSHDIYPGMRVLGFIDETKALHGRRLRSFRILGGLSLIPDLVAKSNLQGIVLAINKPPPELQEELEELSRKHGLKIHRWMVELNEDLTEHPNRRAVRHREAPQAREYPVGSPGESYP